MTLSVVLALLLLVIPSVIAPCPPGTMSMEYKKQNKFVCYLILDVWEILIIRRFLFNDTPTYTPGDLNDHRGFRAETKTHALAMCKRTGEIADIQPTSNQDGWLKTSYPHWKELAKKRPRFTLPTFTQPDDFTNVIRPALTTFVSNTRTDSKEKEFRDSYQFFIDGDRKEAALLLTIRPQHPNNDRFNKDQNSECGFFYHDDKDQSRNGFMFIDCKDPYKSYDVTKRFQLVICEFPETNDCQWVTDKEYCTASDRENCYVTANYTQIKGDPTGQPCGPVPTPAPWVRENCVNDDRRGLNVKQCERPCVLSQWAVDYENCKPGEQVKRWRHVVETAWFEGPCVFNEYDLTNEYCSGCDPKMKAAIALMLAFAVVIAGSCVE